MKKKIVKIASVLMLFFILSGNFAFADYYSSRSTLYYGMRNSEVVNLQNDLKDLGYFTYYKATGYFGSITRNSVKAYQRDKGLSADGIVGPLTARQIKADKVLKMAKHFWGIPYAWGGTSHKGFDCSGYTHYVLLLNGITIPRTSSAQYYEGTWVNKSDLKPGDLVFFTTYKPGPSHVGFYIGGNRFIHASSTAGYVKVSDLNSSYYTRHYIGAKRVI